LNKVFFGFFFPHKRLSHGSHLDYFKNVFTYFLGRQMKLPSSLWRSETALRFHQKYLNLSSEDEQKSYGVGTALWW